jgi:exopolysaccharide production protein ExoQ
LQDRRTRLALAATVFGTLAVALVYTIGTGDLRLTAIVAGLAVAPALLVLALKRSYLFPYGLYVVLVPFDNMLKISGSGTLTKMLGIASAFFIAVYAFRRKGLNQPPLALYFWIAYFAWTLVSIMWSGDMSEAMLDIQQTFSLVALLAVLSVAPVEERDVRAICACIVFGGIAASLYGMYLLHDAPQIAGDNGRLMINVANRAIDPNHFANSLLAPLAISAVALLNARKPSRLFFSAVALLVIIAGIIMSLSREALIATVVLGAVLLWFSRRRIVGMILGLTVGVPVLAGLVLLFPQIGVRMGEAFSTGGAGRTSIWQVGWLAWQQRPFFGWGAGGALDAYDRNYLAVFQFYNAGWGRPPHNTPLHALIELGIVGGLLMAAAYFTTFRPLRRIPRGHRLYDLRVAFTAALVALGVCSLFIDLANYKYVWIIYATIAQIGVLARLRSSDTAPAAYVPAAVQRPVRVRRIEPAPS